MEFKQELRNMIITNQNKFIFFNNKIEDLIEELFTDTYSKSNNNHIIDLDFIKKDFNISDFNNNKILFNNNKAKLYLNYSSLKYFSYIREHKKDNNMKIFNNINANWKDLMGILSRISASLDFANFYNINLIPFENNSGKSTAISNYAIVKFIYLWKAYDVLNDYYKKLSEEKGLKVYSFFHERNNKFNSNYNNYNLFIQQLFETKEGKEAILFFLNNKKDDINYLLSKQNKIIDILKIFRNNFTHGYLAPSTGFKNPNIMTIFMIKSFEFLSIELNKVIEEIYEPMHQSFLKDITIK